MAGPETHRRFGSTGTDLESADEHHATAASIALLSHVPHSSDEDRVSSDYLEQDPLEPIPTSPSDPWFRRITLFFRGRKRRPSPLGWHDKLDSGIHIQSTWTHTFLSCWIRILVFLIPSFIQTYFFSSYNDSTPCKPHTTAYLDGLRGLAALSVFFFHFTNNIYDQIMYAYGGPATEEYGENNGLLQLPILKLIYAGPSAVSVFFVVSGFALSIKPIKQMHLHDDSGLLRTLASASFRRLFRLFLPCFISTFAVFLAASIGLFDATRFIADDHSILTGKLKDHLLMENSFFYQFRDWLVQAIDIVKLFYWGKDEFQGFYSDYDSHLWTIPIEYRASMVLFVTHLALGRFRPTIRLSLLFLLCIYAVNNDRWETLLFWGGMILAEMNVVFLESSNGISSLALRSRIWRVFLIANFISGLYMASYPDLGGEETPGYVFLSTLIPENYAQKRRFWHGIGALQIVLAVSSLPSLSRACASAIPHYLGQISFALYLIHGLVNHTSGYWLLYWAYELTGHWETPLKKAIGFTLALVVNTAVAIWAADIFWRFGDRPCVGFARWLERKCLILDNK